MVIAQYCKAGTYMVEQHRIILCFHLSLITIPLFHYISQMLLVTISLPCYCAQPLPHWQLYVTYIIDVIHFSFCRISIILHVFKARMLHTNAAHIYRKIFLFLALWVVFLLFWTTLDPTKVTQYPDPIIPMCRLQAWNFVAIARK